MATVKHCLKRFLGNDLEFALTILTAFENSTLLEARKARDLQLYWLMLLGTHAIMQTVGECIFGKTGKQATRFYLANFVDGAVKDKKFSLIAEELHDLRNVIAHRWSAASTHSFTLCPATTEGWERRGPALVINPNIYFEQFNTGFAKLRRKWRGFLTPEGLIVRKYQFICAWLGLPKDDPIRKETRALSRSSAGVAISAKAKQVKHMFCKRFDIG